MNDQARRTHKPLGNAALVAGLLGLVLFILFVGLDAALVSAARPHPNLLTIARAIPFALWAADLIGFVLGLAALRDPAARRVFPVTAIVVSLVTGAGSVAVLMWFAVNSASVINLPVPR